MKLKINFLLIAALFSFLTFPCFSAESIDCVRAKPTPILETPSSVKNYSFASISEQEAKESFTLPSGIPVSILHSGCENFALKLHFTITDEGHKLGETNFWLQKASVLLNEVKNSGKVNHISSIQRGILQAVKAGGYKYNEPIETIEGYEYNYFQVNSVSNNKFELIITHVVAL